MEDYTIELKFDSEVVIAEFKEMPLSAKGFSKEEAIENLKTKYKLEMQF